MNKVVAAIMFLFMFSGCAKQDLTKKSEPAAPVQENKEIEPAQPLPLLQLDRVLKEEGETVEKKITDVSAEATNALQNQQLQATPEADVTQEIPVQTSDVVQQKTPATLVEGADKIIAEKKWGISAYNLQTGMEEFYTSKGVFLGSKKRQQ